MVKIGGKRLPAVGPAIEKLKGAWNSFTMFHQCFLNLTWDFCAMRGSDTQLKESGEEKERRCVTHSESFQWKDHPQLAE